MGFVYYISFCYLGLKTRNKYEKKYCEITTYLSIWQQLDSKGDVRHHQNTFI